MSVGRQNTEVLLPNVARRRDEMRRRGGRTGV